MLIMLFVGAHILDLFIPSLTLSSTLTGESLRFGYWTLTRTLVHSDFAHLAVNVLYLYFFGNLVCRAIGNTAFVVIGLVSGAIISLIDVGMKEITIGASGIVSAYMGAALAAYPLRRAQFFYFFGFSNGTFSMPLLWIIAFVTLVDVKGLIDYGANSHYYDNVAYWDHVAGLCIGFALSYAAIRDRIFHRKDCSEPSVFDLLSNPQVTKPRLFRSVHNRRVVDTWVVFIVVFTILGLLATYLSFHSLEMSGRNLPTVQLAFLVITALLAISIYWIEKLVIYAIAVLVTVSAFVSYVLDWNVWYHVSPLLTLLWLMQASTERMFWPAKFWFKYNNSLNADVQTQRAG